MSERKYSLFKHHVAYKTKIGEKHGFCKQQFYKMYKERPVLVPGHRRAAALDLQLLLATLHIHMSAENILHRLLNSFKHYKPSLKAFPETNEIGDIVDVKSFTNLLIECFLNDAIICSFNL